MSEKRRIAVMGPSMSGKTTVARSISLGFWRSEKRATIAFYPWLKEDPHFWGKNTWVTDNFAKFSHVVRNTRDKVIVWDEATTNGGRDRDNIGFLTEIRWRHPVIVVMGHAHAALLPIMRTSLTDLFLALDDEDDAREWAKTMKDPRCLEATTLQQYEFLHKKSFQPVRKFKLTPDELKNGFAI